VTVAAHRHFHATAASRVELVAPGEGASPGTPTFGALMAAGARLQPDLLVIDGPSAVDISGLSVRLDRGARGTLVAVRSEALAAMLSRSVDLVVRLGPSEDGLLRALSVEDATGAPIFVHDGKAFRRSGASAAFAGKIQGAGYGAALAAVFR